MKSLIDIINEAKSGRLNKLHMLTIMIPIQMMEEGYPGFEFFNYWSTEELAKIKDLNKELTRLDDNNIKTSWSSISEFFDVIEKLANEMLMNESNKGDIRCWREIKRYVEK